MAALVKAIEHRRFKQAQILLQLGDNVNQQEKHSGTTPLLAICFLEDENLACRIAKKLLHRGADVCLQDEHGMNPLMQACKLAKEKLVQVLIQSEECDFSAVDSKGNTALIYSIEAGNSHITKALTEAMNVYDVRAADKPNKNGETPLIRAIKLKRHDCKEVLLSDGKASPCARDFDLKLSAKEWELYLNERKENESDDKMMTKDMNRERNVETRVFNRKQNKNLYEKSRMKSSIINCRQGLRANTAFPPRHSVSIVEKNNCDERFPRRRTKSAPLVKGENHPLLSNSVTFKIEQRNKENSMDEWAIPTKKNFCVPQKSLHDQENAKQNRVTMVTSCVTVVTSSKMEQERGALVRKKVLPLSAPVQKMPKLPNEGNGREIASASHQSQLPQLFSLMTQQKSRSFRSSAKERTPEEQASLKKKSGTKKESNKRSSSRRGSLAMIRQSTTRRRWSTTMTALETLGRFSSLYDRSHFKALNTEMLGKPTPRTRRGSVQSNPEALGFTTSKKEVRKLALSPTLARLDPDLSHSLPEKSTLSRVKSAKPRQRVARHNSDSSISTGSLLSRFSGILSKTPVINEEFEEVAASD